MGITNVKERILLHRITSCLLYFTCFCMSDCHPKTSSFEEAWKLNNNKGNELQEDALKIVHFKSNYLPLSARKPDMPVLSSQTVAITTDELIPDFYKVIVVVKPSVGLPDGQVKKQVSDGVAQILNFPTDSVKVSKYERSTGVLKLYFLYMVGENSNNLLLLPSSEVMPSLSVGKLQAKMDRIKILSLKSGERKMPRLDHKSNAWQVFSNDSWKSWQLAVVIASCLLAIFFIIVVILLISNRKPVKVVPEGVEERQVVVQPVLKPDMSEVNIIQPENKDCYIAETDSEHTPSPCRSPLRMKGKGLLERRGSNASLTLDLNRFQENIHYGTPPKECSTEEYLLSASHRLARKQLLNSLKDVKALHAEFWEIPMNHPEKVEVAGSGTKNRYKTILPNESTRVQLNKGEGDPVSCYINANYIRGYANERNAYIATQGPMAHTVNDFWNMVWGQKCPIIVMITKLKEKLKVKCEPYIPDYQGHYKGIDVTVLRVIPRDGYTIRELLLSNGQDSRRVYHFWYTAWPDHKTPDTAKQLLAMAVEVENLRHNSNGTTKGPTVVHCSAGIGRTGCFIAVSVGIQQLLGENTVDVLGVVCGLRLDRGGMVQTAEQYEFVHQALSLFEPSLPDRFGE